MLQNFWDTLSVNPTDPSLDSSDLVKITITKVVVTDHGSMFCHWSLKSSSESNCGYGRLFFANELRWNWDSGIKCASTCFLIQTHRLMHDMIYPSTQVRSWPCSQAKYQIDLLRSSSNSTIRWSLTSRTRWCSIHTFRLHPRVTKLCAKDHFRKSGLFMTRGTSAIDPSSNLVVSATGTRHGPVTAYWLFQILCSSYNGLRDIMIFCKKR